MTTAVSSATASRPPRGRPRRRWHGRAAGVLAIAVLAAVPMIAAANASAAEARRAWPNPGSGPGGSSLGNAPALLPAPHCPAPAGAQPWLNAAYGADCQAQYVIDDLSNPASPLYQVTGGVPAQTTLQRLEAAIATGRNLIKADGTTTTLLALYGLTAAGGTDDGATGERATGLAFPSALALGATWDTSMATAYGSMLGSEFHRTGLSDVLGPVIDIDRTWRTGRDNENFGEDPYLTGAMIAPEVRAIQSQGVMTTVKHCCAYTQEQGRAGQALSLASTPVANTGEDQLVSERAMEEIYGPAWQAAVSPAQGDAMSVMCGYSIINGPATPPYAGADSCGNKFILNDLIKGQYGFQGTFTPDAATAMRDSSVLNFENGADGGDVSLTLAQLAAITGDGSGDGHVNANGSQNVISAARLVDEVRRLVLQSTKNERFANPPTSSAINSAINNGIAAEEATSAAIEEAGAVLLKDQRNVLPLSSRDSSIAVIGTQAGPNADAGAGPASTQFPQVENDGSPYVNPANAFTDTATGQSFGYVSGLAGIIARAGPGRPVTFAPGTAGLAEQPALAAAVTTPDGTQPGFLATYFGGDDPTSASGVVLGTQVVPSVQYNSQGGAHGPSSFPAVPGGSPAVAIPAQFQDNNWSATYQGTYTPPVTGDYDLSVTESGTTKLYVGGRLVSSRARDDFGYTDHASVHLTAGRPVSIALQYSPMAAASGLPTTVPIFNAIFNTFLGDEVHLGISIPNGTGPSLIAQAVAAAKKADVAVVFAGREAGEGHDIQSLSLPGGQDQLIAAVARANPRTVVVLTGGPVAMPWLRDVAGVLEMWEPGATFGTATAALLFGDVNPSGKLPITFPASPDQGPGSTPATYPGITDLATGASSDFTQLERETYAEGTDVGYRYYQAHGQVPLFPFGYGLSYTSFRQRIVSVRADASGNVRVVVADTNTGRRAGADVVEGYVHDPGATGEAPQQLRAFAKVTLAPGQATLVTLTLRPSAFAYWNSGPATGATPGTTSPSAPGADTSTQPPGAWTIASGRYGVSVGSSSGQLAGTATVFLSGHVPPGELNGLFGWALP
jgi:beta-glucosidase